VKWLLLVLMIGCTAAEDDDDSVDEPEIGWFAEGPLRVPVANNAVVADEDCRLFSIGGMLSGRTFDAVTDEVWSRGPGEDWVVDSPLPGPPRIAASAAIVNRQLHVLGGYSIASSGAETTHGDHWMLSASGDGWIQRTAPPTPVDDAVAVSWNDKLILVSGWSQTGNVDAVQVFDGATGQWSNWGAFPGTPVFGATGALAGDDLVIIDGVADAGFSFDLIKQAWVGHLRSDGVDWEALEPAPGPARYRAAGGTWDGRQAVFAGGGDAAYNFDGLAYSNGATVSPVPGVLVWDGAWREPDIAPRDEPTMDHRALATCDDALYSIGGMVAGPDVTEAVWRLEL
jgi:hypothetical protein